MYLRIEQVCSGGTHSMDALEHCNHLLLLLVHLVKATQVPARDDLVDLVGQSFPHKRQTPSLLCVCGEIQTCQLHVAMNHSGV